MDEEKRKVYDALGCLYIHAFRVAKTNNQWTEQSKPYITQGQIWELIEKIFEQQGIDPKNLLPTQPDGRMDEEKLEKLKVYDALVLLCHKRAQALLSAHARTLPVLISCAHERLFLGARHATKTLCGLLE